jgi:hypothetical protein
MRVAFTGIAIIGLLVMGGTAKAQTSGEARVWQGEAFVIGFPTEAAQTACEGYAGIGDFYRVLYRPIIADSPENDITHDEGLTFIGSRNALHYYTDNGVSFAAPGYGYVIYLGTHGQSSRETNPPATAPFHLQIAPERIKLNTTFVTMNGTLSRWEAHIGCNVEIRAVLTLRID